MQLLIKNIHLDKYDKTAFHYNVLQQAALPASLALARVAGVA